MRWKTIVVGTALDGTQLNAVVTVPGPDPAGALTYSPAAGTLLNAGASQALTVTAAPLSTSTPAWSLMVSPYPEDGAGVSGTVSTVVM